MLPLNPNDVIAIIERRRLKPFQINCAFCNRRLGWFEIKSLELIISKNPVPMCHECQIEYHQRFPARKEAISNEGTGDMQWRF